MAAALEAAVWRRQTSKLLLEIQNFREEENTTKGDRGLGGEGEAIPLVELPTPHCAQIPAAGAIAARVAGAAACLPRAACCKLQHVYILVRIEYKGETFAIAGITTTISILNV